MKILVTGSEGFIGKHLVRELVIQGHDVVGMDLQTGQNILVDELPEVDKVVHLAAQTDAFYKDAFYDASVNILGTIRLLMKYGNKLVFASSSTVNYKHCPYAISKTSADMYCKHYGAAIVRLCNIYGIGGHSAWDVFRDSKEIHIYGDGSQVRTYAPVEAAVDTFVRALFNPGEYFILPGSDMTVKEVAAMFPHRKITYEPARDLDIADGRQV